MILFLGLVSCTRRNLWDLFPFAMLMPFYWVLISFAAVKGFLQLFTNPWYWEKTEHGLSAMPPSSGPSLPPPPPSQQPPLDLNASAPMQPVP